MKIAVISDIHGNYDALVEVLNKAKKEGVEHLLVLGDIVGYYYHPDKILNALAEWSFDIIKGNHEKILKDLIVDPSLYESIRLKYGNGHQEAINKLTKEQLEFLKDLPETKSVQFDDTSLLMCHGSPWSNDYYIYPDCENEVILKCDSSAHDFVLIGHSHYAFAIKNAKSILINPGSVGQSRQIGGKASWCIINTVNRCFQMLSTDYNTEKLISEVKEKDPEIKYLTKILKETDLYMNKALNILVTGCGGDIGQSIGKILLKSAYTKNLFGIDISDKNAAQFIYPNFSVGFPFTHPDYLKTLETFIEANGIDIIIPIAEPELRFFSNKNILDKIGKAKMITASALALEVGFDKFKTAEFLKKEGLPFPETFLAKDIKTIDSFPVILKSKTGSGSKDIHKINTMDEFLFYTRNDREDYVVQELITDENGEYTCGLYRSSKGEIRSLILKRELLGGYSGYGEVVENSDITNLLEKLAVKLNLVGSINVQLRMTKNLPKVFEINPRFSSTVFYRHLFGFDDLIWSIEDCFEYELSDNRQDATGRKFYKGYEEYIK